MSIIRINIIFFTEIYKKTKTKFVTISFIFNLRLLNMQNNFIMFLKQLIFCCRFFTGTTMSINKLDYHIVLKLIYCLVSIKYQLTLNNF